MTRAFIALVIITAALMLGPVTAGLAALNTGEVQIR